jgi:ribosomal protein L11 methyltransferase
MAASRFWELSVAAPAGVAEALANFLWEQRALGVVESPEAAEATHLRAFFPPDVDVAALEAALGGYLDGLAELGFGVDGVPRVLPLADANWAEAWREHFRPLRIGRRLIVVPPWEPAAPAGRLRLVIEPGRAFGTGYHGSTATCLEHVERLVTRPLPSALDLGTGSGILAIAAALLGVERVMAVDQDGEAVAVARANALVNGVGDRVECREADAAALDVAPAPLVLANILASAHRRLAPRYARCVGEGGVLVLGGILDREAGEVRAALEVEGFALAGARCRDGWTALALRRRPAARRR